MGFGRSKVGIHDPAGWVFNRMVDAYGARPPYPAELVDAVDAHVSAAQLPVLDVGAGLGHLALPLAQRGRSVLALEPARAMLDALAERAVGLPVTCIHAAAEAVPLAEGSAGAAIVADALHFLDAQLAGAELARVLVPGAPLVLLRAELAATPFMREVVRAMERAAPRRPRAVEGAVAQLAAVAGAQLGPEQDFVDHTPVDGARLLAILRSISFIGPAMNEARAARFADDVLAIPGPRIWSRRLTILVGPVRA